MWQAETACCRSVDGLSNSCSPAATVLSVVSNRPSGIRLFTQDYTQSCCLAAGIWEQLMMDYQRKTLRLFNTRGDLVHRVSFPKTLTSSSPPVHRLESFSTCLQPICFL